MTNRSTGLAALSDDDLERYARHIILKDMGGVGQNRLMRAKLVVVGLGGLGSPLVQYLAASGVGQLILVDGDRVELTNLQRQTLYATHDIGRLKAEVAAERAHALNPGVKVTVHAAHADAGSIDQLIAGADAVLDGTDRFDTRLMISDAAVKAGIPLISGALGATEGQIALFHPQSGPDQPCYRCFLPEAPGEDFQRSCSDTGVISPFAGLMGTMMALDAVKYIAGAGVSTPGQMTIIDALDGRQRRLAIAREPGCPACGHINR